MALFAPNKKIAPHIRQSMLRGDFSISHKIPSIISDFLRWGALRFLTRNFNQLVVSSNPYKLLLSVISKIKLLTTISSLLTKKKSWPISHDFFFFYLFSPKSVCCFSTSFRRSAFAALTALSRSMSASLFAEAAENEESELFGSKVASFALKIAF